MPVCRAFGAVRRCPRSGCRFYGDMRQDPDYSQLLIKISFVRFTLIMFCGILSKYEHLSGFYRKRHSSAECCGGDRSDEKACRAAPRRAQRRAANGGTACKIAKLLNGSGHDRAACIVGGDAPVCETPYGVSRRCPMRLFA